jgi:putative sterol carrier protein
MHNHLIKAEINLYAVIKNLEDLIEFDEETRKLIDGRNISIQFKVKNGPKAWIKFENNKCVVGQGKLSGANVVLWFSSPEHLNKMFDGKANPIPLKGFTKLGFLQKEFTSITEKLEYYLKPELIENPDEEYLKLNTRFTLTVAAFAIPVLAKHDPKAKMTASHLPSGIIQMQVLDGPSVNLKIENGEIEATKGVAKNPDAIMEMKDYETANDFLNGKSDPFTAIALGDVKIKGITPLLDGLSLILDRIPLYL